ncbi:MCE family protein [Nocardioides pantholopis]|uniref:MCE family protein n=1 Tax=Nocardioides pantholopis TaxID=2483798 RepID=UPI000F08441B|nr:MlaD family protein [Nocardioides pantholopis]
MITRRTRLQLLVFAIITLAGVSFVGARYADLDRFFVDDSYTVLAQFTESGGIFAGAEVTYRGVGIGRVDELELTEQGVEVHLEIEDEYDDIPADTLAVVGNRSAVGEQYVELQPQVDAGRALRDGSRIRAADTRTPVATEKLLGDLSRTVASVDQDALRTTVTELGTAFGGTGPDLQRIIDTGTSFIETANANFDLTTALIRDANTVLQGQADSESSLRTFARDLSLFTGTLAGSDRDLRRLIDTGSSAANQLRTFLEENEVELAGLINDARTSGEVVQKNLPGVEQLLVVYPYIVEGGFTVVSKSPGTGLYDAHFGLVLTTNPACLEGYEGTDRRIPQDGENRPMNTAAGCTEPAERTNARGAQNLAPRAGADYDGTPVAALDPQSGTITWGAKAERLARGSGSAAPASLGEDSWKWLYLQPLTSTTP